MMTTTTTMATTTIATFNNDVVDGVDALKVAQILLHLHTPISPRLISFPHPPEMRQGFTIYSIPHVLPYAELFHTDMGGYALRQYIGNNLYDRIRYDLVGIGFVVTVLCISIYYQSSLVCLDQFISSKCW